MFNKSDNASSQIFSDISVNQKYSIMNLLMNIGLTDMENGDESKVLKFLQKSAMSLNVKSKDFMQYMQRFGIERLYEDLQSLKRSQKEYLLSVSHALIACDGKARIPEIEITTMLFEKIGITKEEHLEILEKNEKIIKRLSKREGLI